MAFLAVEELQENFLGKREKKLEKLKLIRLNDRQLDKREVFIDRGR
jgi:hypothetical protein